MPSTTTACPAPAHWPAHAALHFGCEMGTCTRCGLEQDHAESHEGQPCPWVTDDDLSALEALRTHHHLEPMRAGDPF